MKPCETCGNSYERAFEVVMDGKSHTFDCFSCAIHALAPRCGHCGVVMIGHGLQAGQTYYCCAHCARKSGVTELRDHA
jgi:hypothetical protein